MISQEHIATHFIALAPSPCNMRHRILRARKAIYPWIATYMKAIYERRLREIIEKKVMHWYVYISVNNSTWPWNKVSAHKGMFNVNEYNRLFHFINLLVSNDLTQKFVYLMHQHSVEVINFGISTVIVFVHVHAFFAVGVKTMARA